MERAPQPLLQFSDVSIRFGAAPPVVQGLNLTVFPGEIVALVGESGSGKSLSALSALRLLPPQARVTGSVTLGHVPNLYALEEPAVEKLRGTRVGMIFQEPMSALNPLHTVDRQIIEPYCVHHGISRRDPQAKARLGSLLQAVGLSQRIAAGSTYAHQLSGGERQRAMIAMAIANQPPLLIADEPTTALDVTLQLQVLGLLRELQQTQGMAMLFITHDLPLVRRIASRVAVMQAGRIVEEGPVAQVFSAPAHPYTQHLLASLPSGTCLPAPPYGPQILRVEGLRVRYPAARGLRLSPPVTPPVLHDIHFTLNRGETLGIVGESGSGKTTLALAALRLISGQGPVVFLGNRLDRLTPRQLRPFRARMQLVFQDPYGSLNPRLSVGEIVAEGLRVHRDLSPDARAAAVTTMLRQVGLEPEMAARFPHEFSGGQRQRIAIARAMILNPALLVLDEPTSALDMTVQRQVLELLRELQRTHGTAFLFISHDLRVIRAVSHRVLVLKSGVAVEQGSTQQVFTSPQHPYTQQLLATLG